MSRRARRPGTKAPSRPLAWGEPSKTAELYLVKIPAGRPVWPFAGKLIYLMMRLSGYAIFTARRTGIAVAKLFASLSRD
jgi:hypothetical protein